MSMGRLCVRISNCSRDFLSTCGERSTVHLFFDVGSGIGPASRAPVRLAVSTISPVDWSRIRESYALRRIRILSENIAMGRPRSAGAEAPALLDNLGDRARADGAAAFADGEAAALLNRHRRNQLAGDRRVVARHHHLDAL